MEKNSAIKIKVVGISTVALLILTLSRMTLLKVSFANIFGNDYRNHSDTFGENFDIYPFGFYTFKNDTFESVYVDAHLQTHCRLRPNSPGT